MLQRFTNQPDMGTDNPAFRYNIFRFMFSAILSRSRFMTILVVLKLQLIFQRLHFSGYDGSLSGRDGTVSGSQARFIGVTLLSGSVVLTHMNAG